MNKELDKRFNSLEIFAYCLVCHALLVGAEKSSSFWGRRTTHIAQIHRRVTHHEVYVGRNQGIAPKSTLQK